MNIQRLDLVEQVYNNLKGSIISGELKPCSPLRQEDLANLLGVSRQPISHALVLLEREGLLVDIGRKGKMVAPIEPDQLLSLYQVRGALDGLAAQLCSQRVSAELEDQLQRLVDNGRLALKEGSVSKLVLADTAFHRALYELSGNREISKIADASWSHMLRSMHRVLEDTDLRPAIWEQHAQIVNAILAEDSLLAAQRASHHAIKSGEATYHRLTCTT